MTFRTFENQAKLIYCCSFSYFGTFATYPRTWHQEWQKINQESSHKKQKVTEWAPRARRGAKRVHFGSTVFNLFKILLAPISNRTLDSEKHPRKTFGFREKMFFFGRWWFQDGVCSLMWIYFGSVSRSNAEKYQKLTENDHFLGSRVDTMRFDWRDEEGWGSLS